MTTFRSLHAGLALAAGFGLSLAFAGDAAAADAIPANLAAPAGHALRLTTPAKGVQIYACAAKASGDGHEWTFVAPAADLFDAAGNKVGTHGAGPFWQLADGSKVIGAVQQKAPKAGTIPWLLLSVKSSEGQGKLQGVAFIQRVDTAGGAAPEGGCSAANVGDKREVAYTATYHFYAP